ncbi:MAG: CocE/NonD family hydrolase, partial [Blastocatellia bacterium]
MNKLRAALIVLAVMCSGAVVIASSSTQQRAAQPASNKTDQMVPMRDGIKLATSISLPQGNGPWPVVLTRTPYNKDSMPAAGWISHGFAFVSQDVRGKFKSEGQYRPFLDDANDGYDTIEWIAKQPWCSGKVGMFGASAMGIAANEASLAEPPHLTAMFVMVARASVYSQSAYMGGVFRAELNDKWLEREHAEWVIQEELKHNDYDHYFDNAEMSLHWQQVQVPVYNYGGWYDIFNQGNVDDFAGLQEKGGGLAAGNQKLMMGPWGHGGLEEVHYPSNSAVNPQTEAMRWFDYWLKGIDNGIMSEPPVKYYVMGDVTDSKAPGNYWATAISWPPQSRNTSYFLTAGGGLTRAIPGPEDSKDTYEYDPK